MATKQELKELEERLTIALTSESVKNIAMKTLGLNFQRVIYADSEATAESADGTSIKPYKSLQSAINKLKSFPVKDRVMILISPGSAFDEDIIIPGGRMVIIMGLGQWNIGDAAGTNYASTTARNVTWQIDETTPTTFWETLVIGTLFEDEVSSTHTANANGLEISGDFIVDGNGTTSQSLELHLRNVKVKGDYDTTGTSKGVQTYLRRCLFDAGFNSPSGLLNVVEGTQFDEVVITLQYCRMWHCEFRAGMTVTGAPTSSVPPVGIFQSTFTGTFTGPVNSLHLDSVTNHYFNSNGASLAGGATRVLLHDEVIV